ncbi:MAG: hypothetical protein GXP30_10755 [Verrucomicrobia bacterium]|nr:hypothetical protein [Verrucomicrobiota bacterium]
MKKKITGMTGVMALMALSFFVTPTAYAEDGVIIYRAKSSGERFATAKKSLQSNYSYTQQAYQGTVVYYGEGTNLNPNIYSSRVVSFFFSRNKPGVIQAGHRYADPEAKKRDTRIFSRGVLR